MWTQLAKRYQNAPLRLSFDLFNEPTQTQQGSFPPGLSPAQLNAWHAAVIPAIRATGGKNPQRMIWLEPFDNRLELLAIPPNAGPIGVSPHYYTPFSFTHQAGNITPPGMAAYVEDIRYAKTWGIAHQVPIWIGETGVSRNINYTKVPRPPEQRAEYTAHVRNTALALDVPITYWGYNSFFAQYDQPSHAWMPMMRQAVSGLPSPLPVRPVPSFLVLKGGRISKGYDPFWPGFSWDPVTGILSCAANPSGDKLMFLVFPEVQVASGQSWIVRASSFTGNWAIGNCPAYFNPTATNRQGVAGMDMRAKNDKGADIYPGWKPAAPGGFENVYGPISTPDTFFAIDLVVPGGSPAGQIAFSCIRTV
jgi:hypothetical protein